MVSLDLVIYERRPCCPCRASERVCLPSLQVWFLISVGFGCQEEVQRCKRYSGVGNCITSAKEWAKQWLTRCVWPCVPHSSPPPPAPDARRHSATGHGSFSFCPNSCWQAYALGLLTCSPRSAYLGDKRDWRRQDLYPSSCSLSRSSLPVVVLCQGISLPSYGTAWRRTFGMSFTACAF